MGEAIYEACFNIFYSERSLYSISSNILTSDEKVYKASEVKFILTRNERKKTWAKPYMKLASIFFTASDAASIVGQTDVSAQ